jgi:hypothetical protein
MSRSNLRIAVIVLTVITLAIHAFIGVSAAAGGGGMATLGILWILNALGYLGLLLAFLGYIPFFKGKIVEWSLIAFAGITVIAWVVMSGVLNGDPPGALALIDKADEVLLMVATYMHMRSS